MNLLFKFHLAFAQMLLLVLVSNANNNKQPITTRNPDSSSTLDPIDELMRMPLLDMVDSFLDKLDSMDSTTTEHSTEKTNEISSFNKEETEIADNGLGTDNVKTSDLIIHVLDTGECEMLNGTMGECQPTQNCLAQEPNRGSFSLCEWSQHPVTGVRFPLKLCCSKPTSENDGVKEKEQTPLKLTSKSFHWFPSMPSFPYGSDFSQAMSHFSNNFVRCGQTLYSRSHKRHIQRHVFEIPSRWTKAVNESNKSSSKTSISSSKSTLLTNTTILPQPRIVSGVSVSVGEIPWIVSIYLRDQFVCGGSLVADRYVLTAAHCFSASKQAHNYYIRYGSIVLHEGPAIPAKRIAVHPGYRPPVIYHDIAMMELAQPVTFSSTVQPVCLATHQMYGSNMVGLRSTVSGFGDSGFEEKQADFLQAVDIKIIENSFCDKNYRRLAESWKKFRYGIGNTLICAGYEEGIKDACQGDSGGPLTLEMGGIHYLIGIVSFGFRCAQPDFPGIYTAVAHYRPWIDLQMQNNNIFA